MEQTHCSNASFKLGSLLHRASMITKHCEATVPTKHTHKEEVKEVRSTEQTHCTNASFKLGSLLHWASMITKQCEATVPTKHTQRGSTGSKVDGTNTLYTC